MVAANTDRLATDPAYADAVTGSSPPGQRDRRAIADPAGATEIMKQVTQYDPKFLDESVPYTLELLTPADGTQTGCIDVANWQSYGDWMQTNELITGTPDASAVATDQYLPYSCT